MNNEFDNIEVPEEIDLFIKSGLSKAIIDKKKRKNKMAKIAISASVMIILLLIRFLIFD